MMDFDSFCFQIEIICCGVENTRTNKKLIEKLSKDWILTAKRRFDREKAKGNNGFTDEEEIDQEENPTGQKNGSGSDSEDC